MKTILAILLGVCAAVPASAQYYERPPPGYYPAPAYVPPPPRYRVPYGRRCDAVLETPYGPRQLICPIVDPKPLGEPCACPPPRVRGYPPGPYVGGQTIR
jgi:hypothetical protein